MTRHHVVNEADVKQALERALRKPVRDDIWDFLVDSNYVSEVLGDFLTLGGLCKTYRDLDMRFQGHSRGNPKGRVVKRETPPDERLKALGEILAIEASRLPEVRSFREEILNGSLLTPEDVPHWIAEQAKLQEPTVWLTVQLPPSTGYDTYDPFSCMEALLRLPADERTRFLAKFRLETLSYAYPGDEWSHSVTIQKERPLGLLKDLCETLRKRYTWSEVQAVSFVLCGTTPRFAIARTTISPSMNGLGKIAIEVEPRLTRTEVAELYAQAKAQLSSGRDRPMSSKHLRLAVFAAAADDNETWSNRLDDWNSQNPDWRYDDYRNFARDAKYAWERVRGLKWGQTSDLTALRTLFSEPASSRAGKEGQ